MKFVFAIVITTLLLPTLAGSAVASVVAAPLAARTAPLFPWVPDGGYPDDEVARMAGDIGGIEIIHKPFTPLQLATRVHELLDENAVASSAIQRPANGSP